MLKIVLIIGVILQTGNAFVSFITRTSMSLYNLSTYSTYLAYAQVFLAICSIVMIFVNSKRYPEVISGYLMGLLAIGLEFLLSGILYLIYIFFECSLYIKAGEKIRNKKLKLFYINHNVNIDLKDTEWFFKDKDKNKE